jgi:phosphoribosylamine--glycine ligase
MNVLIIGSGGREHALAWKLAQSPRLTQLFCAPGNAGIEGLARCVPIAADAVTELKEFALKERVDLTIVGPEAPLAGGIADEFRKAKLRIFGPTRGAAQIEASKSFAKELMIRHHIPTPAARGFTNLRQALAYIAQQAVPVVIKADGLAQGKGVIIARTREEASEAVIDMMDRERFGQAGRRVIVEEFLEGQELTIMAFTDGKAVVPMIGAQDHKRVGDGDTGPNTGGMGAYAPAPIATSGLRRLVMQQVLRPAVEAMSRVGSPFYGVLYAGLMVVQGRPYVLEFNARFGDPETEAVLPLLKTDLLDVVEAVVEHRLDQLDIEWHDRAAVCVIMTSGGYPGTYPVGLPIRGLDAAEARKEVIVFHAGTKRRGDEIVSAGGRVLGITGIGKDFREARSRAYAGTAAVTFEGCHYRTDIGTAHSGFSHER